MRRPKSIGFVWVVLLCLTACAPVRADRPNIVLIMADDMGFADLGCYGSEIDTPNLDALAADGVRYTNFYNTARCCPSRAALLTGLYPHQAEMGWMTAADMHRPGYRNQLSDKAPTLAEKLKQGGYATYMVGKWHLTHTGTIDTGPNGSWPTQRGFDRFYGTMEGAKSYWRPKWLTRDTTPVTDLPENFFYTTAISQQAARYITEHDGRQPLFLYVAFYAPHFPLHAPAETVAKHRGKYRAGWDALREQRFAKQKQLGLLNTSIKLSPRDKGLPDWQTLTAEQRDVMDEKMATYAAQIDELDQGVGRIIRALKQAGRFDNTIIIFLSDNGSADSGGPFGKGGFKRALINRTGPYTSSGSGWGMVSNTPWRGYKNQALEGGVRTPLIVHWPDGGLPRNRIDSNTGHITDLMPTCLDLAGVTPPEHLEGASLTPTFKKETLGPRTFYFEHEGNRGLRNNRFKLVANSKDDAWRLYDLRHDPTERHDLADKHPRQVEQLSAAWRRWAERCNVLPLDGRSWSDRIKAAREQAGP